MKNKEQVILEHPHDSFSQTKESEDLFFFGLFQSRFHRAEKKRTLEVDAFDRPALDQTPEGLDVDHDVRQFRHPVSPPDYS